MLNAFEMQVIRRNSIADQVLRTGVLRIANHAVGLFLSIVIARALGPEGRGEYYFPVLMANSLVLLCHWSLEHANIYLVSARRAGLGELAKLSSTVALLGGGLAIAAGLLGFFAFADRLPSVEFALILIALLPIPAMIHQIYLAGLLLLAGKVVDVQINALTGSLFQSILLLVFWVSGSITPFTVVLAVGVSACATWALMIRSMKSIGSALPEWNPVLLRQALTFGLQIHVGAIFLFLNLRVDGYLVTYYAGLAALGVYSLAVTLAELVWLATDSLALVALKHQTNSDLQTGAAVTARVCRVNLALAAALGCGLAIVSYPLLQLGYGPEFVPAFVPLLILLPGIVMGSQWRPIGAYLVKLGRPARISVINAAGVAVNLALNILLIPSIGITGAALATTVSYALVTVVYAVWFLRSSGLPLVGLLLARPADFRAS